MRKIYAFNNGGRPNWYRCIAIAEDGHIVGNHICSHEGFMKSDIGVTSEWHHEDYKKHYPDGFIVEWVDTDKLDIHEGLKAALEKNKALPDSAREIKPYIEITLDDGSKLTA